MLTFTVPDNLRRFIRSHQAVAYSARICASSEAIKKLAADPKHMGGEIFRGSSVFSSGDAPLSTILIFITWPPEEFS
jgi:hypothetical protein